MSGNCCLNSDFHVNLGIFYMPQIYDMGPTALLPLRRKACWGFFNPKNPTASAGFEPTNLGTKGQHATSRPPKPQFHYNGNKRWNDSFINLNHFLITILLLTTYAFCNSRSRKKRFSRHVSFFLPKVTFRPGFLGTILEKRFVSRTNFVTDFFILFFLLYSVFLLLFFRLETFWNVPAPLCLWIIGIWVQSIDCTHIPITGDILRTW